MDNIKINGLLWDTENLEIDGNKYFTWEQAVQIAKSKRKRLPTKEDFENLVITGEYTFDEDEKCILFSQGLRFNLEGYKNARHDTIWGMNNFAFLWTSSIDLKTKQPMKFEICKGYYCPHALYQSYRCQIRLVK